MMRYGTVSQCTIDTLILTTSTYYGVLSTPTPELILYASRAGKEHELEFVVNSECGCMHVLIYIFVKIII